MSKRITPRPQSKPFIRRATLVLASIALATATSACAYDTGTDNDCASDEVESPTTGNCEPGSPSDAGPVSDAGQSDSGQ